ncbi:MFS family permease [Psychromicrobium silvestre]|uniref:MFS family permease n=1 Tax=Psychromicrobium silvestre TaxID=1645614 RepID=A0A7Y9LSD8_9MICC|nr:MFS transporter [Psychromicrobium silvestre]NYE94724.1 MFS family permease [Psychromicrobium silvestre]
MSNTAITAKRMSGADRKVLAGTLVGTTIEWYDFFIYAQAAGLVFAQLYFAPLGPADSPVAQLFSWASVGISFLFRPLGAIVAGHLGDRVGRKAMLVLTLIMMGASTALIGVLPTYLQIGVWAPLLLTLLRVLQGFSAGGEWGGAALMAVEHAPTAKRGIWGSYPQIGVPVGLVLASSVIFILNATMGKEQYLAWGWRIPFLISVVLIAIGYVIRRAVAESPVFTELAKRRRESSAPLVQLFRGNTKQVILTALIFIGNNAVGYLLIAFFSSYATKTLKMQTGTVLVIVMVGALSWLAFSMYGGSLSDRIGRVRTFQIGYLALIVWMIPMFLLIDTTNVWLFLLAVVVMGFGLGLSYGPMSALYAEMFPVQVRYSGVSIGYALGAILGGAFAPLLSQWLLDTTKWSGSIALYMIGLCVISIIGVSLVKETRGASLSVE